MRRIVFLFMAALFALPVMQACSFEKSERNWSNDLEDVRFRKEAVEHILKDKDNKKLAEYAVPKLISNIEKGVDPATMIYVLGELRDPAAVPFLIKYIGDISDKDSLDLDRQTEQACIALGKIGEKVAVDPLVAIIKSPNTGRRGKAGALQALGMFGDNKGVSAVEDLIKSPNIPLVVKHFGVISLGKMRAANAIDTLAYSLFLDDKTGLNLFRDGLVALLRIGGQPVRDGMVKMYGLQNKLVCTQPDPKKDEYEGYCKKIRLSPAWVQIKALEVLGRSRDKDVAPFMLEQFKSGTTIGSQMFFEVYAKLIQNMGRVADPSFQEALLKQFMRKPTIPDDLMDKELIGQTLVRTGLPDDKLEDIMKAIEAGETQLTMPDTKKPQSFPHWPVAAMNVLSMLDMDGKYYDRLKKVIDGKKIKSELVGQPIKRDDLFAAFMRRMDVARECKRDAACYAAKIEPKKEGDATHWAQVERALVSLAQLNAKNQATKVFEGLKYDNEFVLDADVFAADRLIEGKDMVLKLSAERDASKLSDKMQMPLEEMSYVILDKKRQLGIIDLAQIEESKEKNKDR